MEVKEKYGLGDEVLIKESTISGREHRKRLIVKSMGPISPMADVEPVLVDLILKSSKRGQKFALDRSNATTFTNTKKMYDEVYEALTECGVATKLDNPIYMDPDYNITSQTQSFGTNCTHTIDHPHYCFVDEV